MKERNVEYPEDMYEDISPRLDVTPDIDELVEMYPNAENAPLKNALEQKLMMKKLAE